MFIHGQIEQRTVWRFLLSVGLV